MMSFWETAGYHYWDIFDIPEEKLISIVHSISRQDLIKWLSWNDPNGIYSDSQSLKEFDRIMTREEGVEILLRQCSDNRIVK